MEAYLKTQELWYYVNGTIERPVRMDPPVDPAAGKDATKVSESAITKYVEAMKLYNENSDIIRAWDLANDKSLGIIQLKMADKLQYLRKSTAAGTWENIKEQFDKQGPASIFVDFRAAVNFHFKENQEPAIQVAGLNTIISHLATKGFKLDPKIQAMLILTSLPASWDGIQSTILANHVVDTLTAESVIPILQEEWKRQQARRSDKSAHFAKTNLHGPPQRQTWQGQNSYNNSYQQAGPSSYNRPAPYQKKFGQKPNHQKLNPGFQGSPQQNVPKGPNWACNQENRKNKKLARQLLVEQVKTLQVNQTPKSDKKDKGKGKAKVANLANRIGQVSLSERLETNESYNERVFVSKDPKVIIPSTMTTVQEDVEMVSLGDEEPYQQIHYLMKKLSMSNSEVKNAHMVQI